MNKSNIVLIGMPGVGKSTLGKRLAALLNMPFLDSDKEIERRMGKKLQTLISERGSDGFLALEREVSRLFSFIVIRFPIIIRLVILGDIRPITFINLYL